jgi:hypothetical protein
MYLIVAIIIFVAAVFYGGYDPKGAERLADDDISNYYFYAFGLAVAWPIALIAVIFGGLGYGVYLIGKSFRKK